MKSSGWSGRLSITKATCRHSERMRYFRVATGVTMDRSLQLFVQREGDQRSVGLTPALCTKHRVGLPLDQLADAFSQV